MSKAKKVAVNNLMGVELIPHIGFAIVVDCCGDVSSVWTSRNIFFYGIVV